MYDPGRLAKRLRRLRMLALGTERSFEEVQILETYISLLDIDSVLYCW